MSHVPYHIPSFFAWQRLTPAVLLLLFMLSGCATTGVNRGDVNLISMEEEWQLGRQLEQDLNRELRLVNDGTANAYIERIGQQIVRQTELADVPWSFHIVDDPAINAFNTPGGNVYVNTGLILAADNVAQLVGVMSHEIAHGVARHGTERLTKAYGLNIGAGLLLGSDPSAYEQVLAQIAGTGAIAKFSRNDEREADELGVRYMYQAGYDPEGMAQMFEHLLAERQGRPGAVAQFFSTHPLTERRIRDVRRAANQLPGRSLTMQDGDLASIQRRLR